MAPRAVSLPLFSLTIACAEPAAEALDDTGAPRGAAARFLPYAEDGRSVAALEPGRYLGLWYEIATTPSFIEADCHGTTAEYGVVDEDTISVYNRCLLGSLDGDVNEIEGTADFADASYARLLVDFGFGFAAPYNVVELDGADGDAPYRYAAVNSANLQIWILSRTPTLEPDLYDEIVDRMAAQGLETDALVMTEQAGE
jgi:apolipoprotein D and lipocalin family protein